MLLGFQPEEHVNPPLSGPRLSLPSLSGGVAQTVRPGRTGAWSRDVSR